MSQVPLAPPPQTGQPIDGWLYLLWRRLAQFLWSAIDKTGSSLTDIETRNHADLQNINTASYTHLTATQATDLTDAGDSALHYHASDRDSANFTGTTWTDLTDGGTTSLHSHSSGSVPSHNDLSGIQGGATGDYYHLTSAQVTDLTDGGTTTLHSHAAGASVDPATNGFRLTLTTGVPVTTSDVTGATTIYCCPYKGSSISLYDGSAWGMLSSAQFSLAIGTVTSGLPYDIFCYNNAGTPTLEKLAWSTTAARATALVYQDGILSKSGATTRRYLGTFIPTSTSATEDSLLTRYLWNYYHRVPRRVHVVDTTDTWMYTTNSWRIANGGGNYVLFLVGVVEDSVSFSLNAMVSTDSASLVKARAAIGFNSYTGPSGTFSSMAQYDPNAPTVAFAMTASLSAMPVLGINGAYWLEYGDGSTALTFWGDNTGTAQSGLTGTIYT